MKKIIQIVSFLALVFVLAGIDAQAQGTTRIEADIPFEFVIGDKAFAPGKYTMRLRRVPGGAETVELRDAKHKVVFESFAMRNGDTGRGRANLVFDSADGYSKLTKIQTGDKGFTINSDGGSDALTLAAKKKKSAETKN